jgi:hypothetical protein
LINWKVVIAPRDKGILGMKDTSLMNIEMGAKMIWRLITGKLDWWKKIISKKYF